ncbi:uncharacterized protein F5Z01DRAFT_479848 [Emericellopsis atlantica]|uniref:Uncharacterized protein n=1 Tax=Emericellopsis atlantica TaxID=2614577 RepID=A0A9P7ZR06_9HYPO|nr:uncharacterized protein F5Z01DRAFT_479848 [Emericellopsis atlantica]KAG9256615.1 hypothetical protein F5Z01DRAFT_479848 [Emericellopsis atlantica]
MLKATVISFMAMALPIACQVTEPVAVRFSTNRSIFCSSSKDDYWISDGVCVSLPGKWLSVDSITKTCRGTFTSCS